MTILIITLVVILIIGSMVGLYQAYLHNQYLDRFLHQHKKLSSNEAFALIQSIKKYNQKYNTINLDEPGICVITNTENKKTYVGANDEILRFTMNKLIDKQSPFYDDMLDQPFSVQIHMLDDSDLPHIDYLKKKLISITHANTGYNKMKGKG